MERGRHFTVAASRRADSAVTKSSAMLGLILDVACVVALVVCLAGVGMGNLMIAVTAGLVALMSLTGSLIVLLSDDGPAAESRVRRAHMPRHALPAR
jgi:hypothetical protein